jgi:hypothetical protein
MEEKSRQGGRYMKKMRNKKLVGAMLLMCLLLMPFMKRAEAAVPNKRIAVKTIDVRFSKQNEIARIVQVLKKGTGNRQLADKAREKLGKLSPEDIRLIGNLCAQIKATGREPGADLAFAMVSALLVFL